MERFWILIVIIAAGIAFSTGCAPRATQGPNGKCTDTGRCGGPSTEQQTAEVTDAARGNTTEEPTFDNELECPSGMAVSGLLDYAPGAEGEKASPVELARRDFSEQIEEGDDVGLAAATRYGGAVKTVRVVRNGRIVALIDYQRAGAGWLRGSYEACAGF